MLCDLHVHTTASDGTYSPAAVVELAAQRGLSAIAITDHDTVAGIDEAMDTGRKLGVRIIPGFETATICLGCEVHLLGLFVNHCSDELIRRLAAIRRTRVDRNYETLEGLAAAGLNISPRDFGDIPMQSVTRVHIAKLLAERGYGKDWHEAQQLHMTRGGPGFTERKLPPLRDVIDLIHGAEGLVITAHVNQIAPKMLWHTEAVCRQLMSAVVDGLETRHSGYDDAWAAWAEALASELGCLRSGGTDFHGSIKPGLELGEGYGNLSVPYEYLEALEAAASL